MKKQILFVDDEREVLDGLHRILYDQATNWDMVFVISAEEALLQLARKQYDVIVMDVNMPGQNGLELLATIRKDDRCRGTQIIMLTGIENQDLKRRALALGATDLLNKPIQKEDLLARINSVLQLKSYYDNLQTQNIVLEEQLLKSQRMELVGVLAGGAVHDLNNLLTVILGHGELISLALNNPLKIKERLEEMNNAMNRARKIVEQILNFARQSDRPLDLCNVGLIIEESLLLLKPSFPKDVTIKWKAPEASLHIYADQTQLYQLLMNLYQNALQSMGEKGTLWISITKTYLRADSLPGTNTVLPGPYLKLEISDSGSGMDETTLKHIFDPLFTTKLSKGGTGLGLSVVQRIVQNHKGLITVESEPGEGTTFQVYMPCILEDDRLRLTNPGVMTNNG